jgi:hypothetical protein
LIAPLRLAQKRKVSAVGLDAAGRDENAALNRNDPDSDKRVRACTGSNAKDLGFLNGFLTQKNKKNKGQHLF